MPVDEKLAELDRLLKSIRASTLAMAARGFDPEIVEVEESLDQARLLVAQIRLEVLHVRDYLE